MGATLSQTQPLKRYGPELLAVSFAQNILSLALPITILQVYDRVIPNAASQTLGVFVIGLGVVLVIDFMLSVGRSYVTGWTGARFQHRMACNAVNDLFRSDLRKFEAIPVGVHLQQLRAVDAVKGQAGMGPLLMVDLPFALLFFALIGLIAGPLALVPLAVVGLIAGSAYLTGRWLTDALDQRRAMDDRRYNFMIEVLRTIRTVKGLGLETLMVRRYERLQAQSAAASYRVSDTNTGSRNSGQFFSQFTAIAVGAWGSTMVMDGSLTIGGLAACTLLASRSSQPMMRVLGAWTQMQNARVTRQRLAAIRGLPRESSPDAPAMPRIKGDVELDRVTFSYTDPDRPVLRDVALSMKRGETIAVTGSNGSGKSTLLGLMMGLLIPDSGRVLIDGENVWEHDAVSLRSQVVYLPQKPVLFRGTILDNLTMFRGDAHVDAAMHMAERLGLHDAVSRMAKGYDTPIEHAANDGLPGGVRQQIALVRALTLVEEPRLVLFDEANTFLDQRSDTLLLDVLREVRNRGCSVVIVSHRPSYLALADRAYVIRDRTLEASPPGVRASVEQLERAFSA